MYVSVRLPPFWGAVLLFRYLCVNDGGPSLKTNVLTTCGGVPLSRLETPECFALSFGDPPGVAFANAIELAQDTFP